MARPVATHPFDQLIARAAAVLAERLGGVFAAPSPAGRRGRPPGAKSARRTSRLSGTKLDMSCRVEGCKNRSGGPRFGFICEEHRNKLSKKQLEAAREAWKAAHSA